MKKEKKRKIQLPWIVAICLCILCVLLFQKYVGRFYQVEGDSMNPALTNQNILYVNKLAYQKKAPQRYDMIVFSYQYDTKIEYIKRIIALPGETVEIRENRIFIDGVEEKEYYGIYDGDRKVLEDMEACQLGEDEYFVLGDNREHSVDSRSGDVGMIKQEQILGKALFRIWPFSAVGSLKYQ